MLLRSTTLALALAAPAVLLPSVAQAAGECPDICEALDDITEGCEEALAEDHGLCEAVDDLEVACEGDADEDTEEEEEEEETDAAEDEDGACDALCDGTGEAAAECDEVLGTDDDVCRDLADVVADLGCDGAGGDGPPAAASSAASCSTGPVSALGWGATLFLAVLGATRRRR